MRQNSHEMMSDTVQFISTAKTRRIKLTIFQSLSHTTVVCIETQGAASTEPRSTDRRQAARICIPHGANKLLLLKWSSLLTGHHIGASSHEVIQHKSLPQALDSIYCICRDIHSMNELWFAIYFQTSHFCHLFTHQDRLCNSSASAR